MTVLRASAALLCCFAAGACGGDDDGDDGACTADGLAAALAGASPGQTVSLGACRLEGSFTVPAGVTLAGAGRADSVLVGGAGGAALTLTPGDDAATAVRGLSVESPEGCVAIVARGGGAGRIALEDVAVVAPKGIGIGLEGLAEAALRTVDVTGGIAAADADQTAPPLPPYACATADPATHGLVLVDVSAATLEDVTIAGFAAFGALFVGSGTSWARGGAHDGVGTGLEVWGGTATLQDVALERSRDGLAPIESYGVVLAGGAEVQTLGLIARDNDATGVFVDGAATSHEAPLLQDNGFAGLWAQNVTSFTLTGAGTLLSGNGFAGLALVDATSAVLHDARIEGTVSKLGLSGPTAAVRAADGVHLVRSTAELADLTLVNNARVGLLLDLGGASTGDLTIAGVTVDAAGDALGAVAQNGDVLPGWDDGVDRQGATAVNDPLFADTLDVASGVGPSCIPDPGALLDEGLAALLP